MRSPPPAARTGDAHLARELLNGVLRELQLHAGYAKELKIELARVQPYRQVEAYTDFLLATAWHGEPGETIAAMTPCMRLYGYLGTELAKTITAGNPYQQWITTYSGSDFQALVTRMDLMDFMAEDSPAIRVCLRVRHAVRTEFLLLPPCWSTKHDADCLDHRWVSFVGRRRHSGRPERPFTSATSTANFGARYSDD